MTSATLAEQTKSALGDIVLTSKIAFDELTITVPAANIVETLTKLRDDPACQFEVLIDICGVDYPQRKNRFDVVYHLLSARKNQRIRIKIETDEVTPVPSVIPIFPGANWCMRRQLNLTDH